MLTRGQSEGEQHLVIARGEGIVHGVSRTGTAPVDVVGRVAEDPIGEQLRGDARVVPALLGLRRPGVDAPPAADVVVGDLVPVVPGRQGVGELVGQPVGAVDVGGDGPGRAREAELVRVDQLDHPAIIVGVALEGVAVVDVPAPAGERSRGDGGFLVGDVVVGGADWGRGDAPDQARQKQGGDFHDEKDGVFSFFYSWAMSESALKRRTRWFPSSGRMVTDIYIHMFTYYLLLSLLTLQ